MPSVGYIWAVILIAALITFALRAVPFAILAPLRESGIVKALGIWMPAGVLGILAVSTARNAAADGHAWQTLVAIAVTAVVHLAGGRRMMFSVAAGTLTFVALLNWV